VGKEAHAAQTAKAKKDEEVSKWTCQHLQMH